MSINTLAAALELKPKSEQKIKKLVRRNASDKLKLIRMVHDNPILWDSRLPNFKGAEGEKNRAWELIGKEFNAPGRRVARAFKSLRESYRRELAHVKLMGSNFKPKWSLYEAMDFLRDVIRERKGGSQSAENSVSVAGIGLNLSSAFGLHNNDLHQQQHHHPHHHRNVNNNKNNNNNNYINISNNNNNSNDNDKTSKLQTDVMLLEQEQLQHRQHSPKFNDSGSSISLQQQQHSPTFNNVTALNLSKCSSTSLSLSNENFYKFVKPELDFSNHHQHNNNNNNSNNNNNNNDTMGAVCAQQLALHVAHARPHLLHNHQDQNESLVTASPRPSTPISGNGGLSVSHDSRVTSTHNDNQNTINSCNSTQNTLFDETGDGVDGADDSSIRSGVEDADAVGVVGAADDGNNAIAANLSRIGSAGEEVEELEAIDADFPYPFILDSNSTTNGCIISKRRRKDLLSDNDDDDDDYEMQMMKQHRRLRRHQQHAQGHSNGNSGVSSHLMLDIPQPQTVREVLNSKFCGFISAKLNSMEDSEAENLMNKILMLLVQTQTNDLK